MNIYVGNISFDMTEDDLRAAFEAHGKVDAVNIIKDKYSGRSKGFGFVEMSDENAAKAAIEALNQKDIKGRKINVNVARPKTEGGGGRDGGPRGGGGGRSGGGFGGGGRR